jgi:MFS family permease
MIPTVFATAYIIFPRSRMGLVAPLIGLVATLAPTIGPTVGGYLTDTLSWHWLFFINVVPGILVTIAAVTLIDFDKPDLKLLNRFDWWGLVFMAGFLGGLEYVLEEGPRNDWFGDDSVLLFAWISAISAIAFFSRVLTASTPIVDLRAFADRNFALGSLFSFIVGIGLYGLTYLYPLYLAEIRGYDARMIGDTVFVSGLAMFIAAPVADRLPQLRRRRLVDDLPDQRLGLLGAAMAANLSRRGNHDRDAAGEQYGARYARAGAGEERLGPFQSDAQSRRRDRPRRTYHNPQRPHRPASGAAARGTDLRLAAGDGDAEQSPREFPQLRQRC